MLKQRAAGILLHPTSLPSPYGIGDFGPTAYAFAEFLKKAGANYWQLLPLNFTTVKSGHSPYSCYSAFAGNPLLISPELLVKEGLLSKADIAAVPRFSRNTVDFSGVERFKRRLLRRAFERFSQRAPDAAFEAFKAEESDWLDDFVFFVVFKHARRNTPWSQWPAAIRRRQQTAMRQFVREHSAAIEREKFIQFLFAKQFSALKRHCNDNGILLFGDLPIYVVHDSADVWANPELFKLGRDKKPTFIAGVPPDYFSKTGQLWGNPVYDWDAIADSDYRWWIDRLRHNLDQFDLLRIDHFRGFEAYWQVPSGHKTAIKGQWVEGPGRDLFKAIFRQLPKPALVAEDLGVITPGVRELITQFDFPGMRVLQFAFGGGADNTHLPHNHIRNCVVYTGTHDNTTTLGWYKNDLPARTRKHLAAYLGRRPSARTVVDELTRLAMASPAHLCIIPMQDLLSLDGSARMNNPARRTGNWLWRMPPARLTAAAARTFRNLCRRYGRC